MSSMDDLHDSSSIQEIIGENGDQETKMIVDQERKVFVGSLNWDTTEGVMSSLGGEPMDTDESGLLTDLEQNQQTVVFDDVGNEVSITATDDRAGVTVTAVSMPVTKTPRATKGKSTVATPTRMKPIQPNQGGPVVIPISNQASGLAQFITSIRPPAIPGAQQQVKVVRPGSVTTKFMPVKKPPAIAPAPSPAASGLVTKAVIMTSSGQQLVISSPVKSGVDHNQKSNTITLGPATGNVVNQGPQQIMLFSPIKQSPGKLVQVRPKPPSTSGTPIEIQSVSQQKDVKPLQIIRLVQTSNSLTPTVQTSGTTKAYTINRMPTISTITSNFSRAQTSTASSTGSVVTTQKILIPASAVKSSASTGMIQSSSNTMQQAFITNSGGGQVIMLPAHMFQGQGSQSTASVNQIQIKPEPAGNGNVKHVTFSAASSLSSSATQRTSFVPIAPSPLGSQPTIPASQILAGLSGSKAAQNSIKSEGDANRPRKPCNCTKSQCLKLYCDCFANGEFCSSCNCINCANNLEHEEDRQKAIRQCLERNPHAFHPKIGKGRGDVTERRHTKGCNCRRSGCLKNYCECYEAKILCSDLCKCIGCKNYEDSYERKTLMHLADAAEVRSAQQSVASKAKLWGSDFTAKLPIRLTNDKMDRLHCSFITPDVLEATCQCLLATAEDGEKLKLSYSKIEERILDEFGSCLSKIIETANKARK